MNFPLLVKRSWGEKVVLPPWNTTVNQHIGPGKNKHSVGSVGQSPIYLQKILAKQVSVLNIKIFHHNKYIYCLCVVQTSLIA